ncbi:MAG TPA: hypothetical protein VID71_09820 [Steroidobacteraceae bacterium]
MHWSMRSSLGLIGTVLALASAGCGGSSDTSLSPTGVWMGEDSTNGLNIVGLVDANGAADFLRADGAQFVGQGNQMGNSVSFPVQGVTQFGSAFGSSGPTYGSGTFNADISGGEGGSALAGTMTFTPNAGSAATWQWNMSFDLIYNSASSLATISGNYGDTATVVADGLDPLQGASVSISTGGVVSGQNPVNSCVLNGSVTVVNALHSIYQIAYTLQNCVDTATGSYSALNGVSFSGLAYRDPSYNPVLVMMGVTGEDGAGHHYGVVSQLSAN